MRFSRLEFLSEDLIPVTRLAVPVEAGDSFPLPGVIRFVLTDERQNVSEHIFELRG